MIQQVLIGLGLIFGAVGCLSNPFIGLVTLMGVNMIQPGELYPVFAAMHVERIMALLALAVLFIKGYRFAYPPVTKWCLVFYCTTLASIPLAFWISNSLNCAADFGKIIIIHLLYVSLVTTRRRIRIVLLSFSVLVGYLAVTSLLLYFQGQFIHTMGVDRIVGLTDASNNADTLGLTLATGVPIMYLFTLRSSRLFTRLLVWGLIGLCLWTLMLTGSRGSLLTFVLILLLAIALSKRRLVLLPAVVVMAAVIWSALPAQYQARYTTVDHLQGDESYQNRLLSWQGGWQMFLHNPITGIGIGDYTFANGSKYWPAPRKIWLDAHSLYFQILGELGLVGLITFGGLVTVMFKSNNQIRRNMTVLDAAAAAGHPGVEPVPLWLKRLPTTCNLCIIGLLYCGYAYHDAYRSTWYFLAAITGSLFLMTQRELANQAAAATPAACAPQGCPTDGDTGDDTLVANGWAAHAAL